MKSFFAGALCIIFSCTLSAQNISAQGEYRATPEKINNLVHTKLEVKPDFAKRYLYGKAWITLQPHFYPTRQLVLQAKGMDINEVKLIQKGGQKEIDFNYDGKELYIKLDRVYTNKERYTIFIDYVSKPDELKESVGSAAIASAKGLYFIDPDGTDPKKPTQIWTQGETEASSVWFPTIDRNNQKTTQEVSITVDQKYVTLSNGKLISQKKNVDGTRTDYWKMDLPHSPYLFYLGVGDYAVVKDQWRGKPLLYYVDKEYGSVAKKIFGQTPAMLDYFSERLGVTYPWPQLAQVTGHDYVSGAMENTTAILYQNWAQQNARELKDGVAWDYIIAHEIFHHWFGDLVTTESWSNLTVNESFADFSEYMWLSHYYSADRGDHHRWNNLNNYLNSNNSNLDLVRFYYNNQEDMFDLVSYSKGGNILWMLKSYIGEEAFYQSLKLYLTRHQFKNTEAHDLRMAFEEVTGKDWNWFFNQWYFGSGHPLLNISYSYLPETKKVQVIVEQKQTGNKVFRLPVKIDIYQGREAVRHEVVVNRVIDTFSFSAAVKPDLVNFDADKTLVGRKTENKTLAEYIHQYRFGKNYFDRREAVQYFIANFGMAGVPEIFKEVLKDRYPAMVTLAINTLLPKVIDEVKPFESIIVDLARNQKTPTTVRGAALNLLGRFKKPEYLSLFQQNLTDSSYSVAGGALAGIRELDIDMAMKEALKQAKDASGALSLAIISILSQKATEEHFEVFCDMVTKNNNLFISNLVLFANYLAQVQDTEKFKKGIDLIGELKKSFATNTGAVNYIHSQLNSIIQKKEQAKNGSNNAQIDAMISYVKNLIETKGK